MRCAVIITVIIIFIQTVTSARIACERGGNVTLDFDQIICHKVHKGDFVYLPFRIDGGFLECKNCEIEIIHLGLFDWRIYSHYLILARSEIKSIEPGALQNFTKLISIDLSENRLSIINKGIFEKLSQLTDVNLSTNEIITIENDAFSQLNKLSILQLQRNNLTKLTANLFSAQKQLKVLNLENNQLNVSEKNAFSGLRKLEKLNLNKNRLGKTLNASTFADLRELTELSLESNSIDTLPIGMFAKLEKLKTLNLSANALFHFTYGTFTGLKKLETLKLDDNKLASLFEHTFGPLSNLKNLNVSRNLISSINAESLIFLETIDFSKNKLNCENLLSVLKNFSKVEGLNYQFESSTNESNVEGFACIDDTINKIAADPLNNLLSLINQDTNNELKITTTFEGFNKTLNNFQAFLETISNNQDLQSGLDQNSHELLIASILQNINRTQTENLQNLVDFAKQQMMRMTDRIQSAFEQFSELNDFELDQNLFESSDLRKTLENSVANAIESIGESETGGLEEFSEQLKFQEILAQSLNDSNDIQEKLVETLTNGEDAANSFENVKQSFENFMSDLKNFTIIQSDNFDYSELFELLGDLSGLSENETMILNKISDFQEQFLKILEGPVDSDVNILSDLLAQSDEIEALQFNLLTLASAINNSRTQEVLLHEILDFYGSANDVTEYLDIAKQQQSNLTELFGKHFEQCNAFAGIVEQFKNTLNKTVDRIGKLNEGKNCLDACDGAKEQGPNSYVDRMEELMKQQNDLLQDIVRNKKIDKLNPEFITKVVTEVLDTIFTRGSQMGTAAKHIVDYGEETTLKQGEHTQVVLVAIGAMLVIMIVLVAVTVKKLSAINKYEVSM